MMQAVAKTRAAFLDKQTGNNYNVLFETGHNGIYEGYTENYTPVRVHSPVSLCGKLLPVKIMQADEEYCIGELIGE